MPADDEDEVTPMVVCMHCEHLVPESNLLMHQMHCQGRKRPAREQSSSNNNDNDDDNKSSANNDNNNEDDIGDCHRAQHRSTRRHTAGVDTKVDEQQQQQPFLPRARWESSPSQPPRGRSEITTIDDDDDDDYKDDSSVMSDSNPILHPPTAAAMPEQDVIDLMGADDDDDEGQWTCPRCTLDNASTSSVCEACSFRRPESERPADPTRRERLMDGSSLPLGASGSGGGIIGGAALLGSVLGGTGAYMRGQSLSSGLLNGGLTGAMSGAILNELVRNNALQQQQQQQRQSMFSASSSSGPTMRSFMISTSGGPRVVTSRNNGNNASNEINQLLSMLLAQQLQAGAAGGLAQQQANTDHMSYEQLLQMFGTGTENLGASQGQIRSLPESTIQDVDKLPADSRQCAICLEDFKTGDKRKIMPCLHGFHADCVDKWLRTNGSCPICKNRLDR